MKVIGCGVALGRKIEKISFEVRYVRNGAELTHAALTKVASLDETYRYDTKLKLILSKPGKKVIESNTVF